MQEQLLEGEAPPGLLRLVEALRKMGGGQRVRRRRQAAAGAELGRKRLDRTASERPGLPGPLAKPLRAQPFRCWMDGHDPGRVDSGGGAARAEHLVGLHAKAGAVELAEQEQPRALGEAVDEPGLVEPDGLRRPGVVGDRRLHDHEAAATRGPHAGRAHVHLDRRLLADPQLGELSRLSPVPVGVRNVQEDVAHGAQAHVRGRGRQLGPRALQRLDARGQETRPGRRAEVRRAQLVAVLHGAGGERGGRSGIGLGPLVARRRHGLAHRLKARTGRGRNRGSRLAMVRPWAPSRTG